MKKATLLFLIAVVFQSCHIFKPNTIKSDNYSNVYFFQNGIESLVNEKIIINNSNFSLRFFAKPYNADNKDFNAVQVASFINAKDLDLVNIGDKISEVKYFGLGTGMAPSHINKYESLYLTSEAHHYLMYDRDGDKRVNLLEDYGDYLKLEFEIKNLIYNDQEEKLSETSLLFFYLAILIDHNANGIVDSGELTKISVQL